jgi:spore coat polysaccharide biosynthesis protein SpsF
MKTLVIIQARMGSTRLPGKVLMPLAGKPALEHVVERVRAAREVDGFVIATSTLSTDNAVAEYCAARGWPCVRGSEDDVLARFVIALKRHPAEIVVRITGDCPLTDPAMIDQLVGALKNDPRGLDYISNTQAPRKIPHGLDVEVMRADALLCAGREAAAREEREHVTPYLYRNPALYTLGRIDLPVDLSAHRWTLDTSDDHALLERVLQELTPGAFRWQDTLEVLEKYPKWVSINSSVTQKTLAHES